MSSQQPPKEPAGKGPQRAVIDAKWLCVFASIGVTKAVHHSTTASAQEKCFHLDNNSDKSTYSRG